jgi:hypothetical protein
VIGRLADYAVLIRPTSSSFLVFLFLSLFLSSLLVTSHSLFICHPDEGMAERRQAHCLDPRPAGRGASPCTVGTLASRRSTVAILGRRPRFHLRHFLRIRAASSSQPGRSAWRAGPRASVVTFFLPPLSWLPTHVNALKFRKRSPRLIAFQIVDCGRSCIPGESPAGIQ